MKKFLMVIAAAAGVALAGGANAAVDAAKAKALAQSKNCLACHAVDKKLVGPAYLEIAKKYKGDTKEILQFNDLIASGKLVVGDIVIVPDGELATPKPVIRRPSLYNPAHDTSGPDYGLYYTRPLAVYGKSQGLHGYNAVDLTAPYGSPIYSVAEGTVIIARNSGWNGGYGSYVVIAHPNGTQTLYSHASKVIAYEGQYVSRGQVIAYLGSSGKVTGPHLHIEVRGAKNPF